MADEIRRPAGVDPAVLLHEVECQPEMVEFVLRLTYAEAVQTLSAVAEAMTPERSQGELLALERAKRKILVAIGLE